MMKVEYYLAEQRKDILKKLAVMRGRYNQKLRVNKAIKEGEDIIKKSKTQIIQDAMAPRSEE